MSRQSQILVVDDEAGPRESIKIILKPEFGVTAVDRGSRALELLRERQFDLVLLDLTMPEDLSGTETLEQIRDAGVDVEVIVITGQGALESAVECLRLGARDYLAKPYRAEDVRAAVHSTLAGQAARRRANGMREHLLENLSHEFRTPLHAISGYSEILCDEASESLSDAQQRALARIQLNSDRLLSYLEGLFYLAEMDSGHAPPVAREFAVHPWLDQIMDPIFRDAQHGGVDIDVRCDRTLRGFTHPDTLGRLVRALIYAAADQPSGRTIAVRVDPASGRGLRISIDPGREISGTPVGARAVELSELNLSDPLAQEVITRAAGSIQARITAEIDGSSILQIHIEVPGPTRPAVSYASATHVATALPAATAR